jgi:hypothetical protein
VYAGCKDWDATSLPFYARIKIDKYLT